jgi:ketosteroid isomerase-like protein
VTGSSRVEMEVVTATSSPNGAGPRPELPASGPILRQRLQLTGRAKRNFEDRLVMLFPRLASFVGQAVCRLPMRSRLRRELVRRAVLSAWEAANRGDIEMALAFYHPDVETFMDPKMVGLGFDPVYRGCESRLAIQQRGRAEWGEWRYEGEEILFVDANRLLTIGRMKGKGLMSGAAVDIDWAALVTTVDGKVTREEVFLDRRDALRAVGIQPALVR